MDNMINSPNEEKAPLIVLCNNLIHGVSRKGWSLAGSTCGSSPSSRRIMKTTTMGARSSLLKPMVFSPCIIPILWGLETTSE